MILSFPFRTHSALRQQRQPHRPPQACKITIIIIIAASMGEKALEQQWRWLVTTGEAAAVAVVPVVAVEMFNTRVSSKYE